MFENTTNEASVCESVHINMNVQECVCVSVCLKAFKLCVQKFMNVRVCV